MNDCFIGDHVHPITRNDGSLCPIVDFNYSALDPDTAETLIPLSLAVSGVARILSWATELEDLRSNGARIAALSVLLGSTDKYRSLAAIAREAKVSRAIISRWLLELRDRYGIRMSMRGSLIRENCRQAQQRSVAAGRHVSQGGKKTALAANRPD